MQVFLYVFAFIKWRSLSRLLIILVVHAFSFTVSCHMLFMPDTTFKIKTTAADYSL